MIDAALRIAPFPLSCELPAQCRREWSAQELATLRAAYASADCQDQIGLDGLAIRLGRHKANICRKARSLGLTDQSRRKKMQRLDRRKYGDLAAYRAVQSQVAKDAIAKYGHPRGMLDKKHKPEVHAHVRAKYREWWSNMGAEERQAHALKALKSKLAKHGTLAPRVERGTWKAGWREIGGRCIYFRSRWEANYARYLEWLRIRGDILDWEYEPETFWFEAIKRGVRSYKPDFRIHEVNGTKPFHEVKGWMDARSKTTLKRMAKYHPNETIILIRAKEYRAISRFSAMIGGWE